jgi:hypothetical protein
MPSFVAYPPGGPSLFDVLTVQVSLDSYVAVSWSFQAASIGTVKSVEITRADGAAIAATATKLDNGYGSGSAVAIVISDHTTALKSHVQYRVRLSVDNEVYEWYPYFVTYSASAGWDTTPPLCFEGHEVPESVPVAATKTANIVAATKTSNAAVATKTVAAGVATKTVNVGVATKTVAIGIATKTAEVGATTKTAVKSPSRTPAATIQYVQVTVSSDVVTQLSGQTPNIEINGSGVVEAPEEGVQALSIVRGSAVVASRMTVSKSLRLDSDASLAAQAGGQIVLTAATEVILSGGRSTPHLDLGKVPNPYPFVPPLFEVNIDVSEVDLGTLRRTLVLADYLSNCNDWVGNATLVPAERLSLVCEFQAKLLEEAPEASRQAIVLVGVPDEPEDGAKGGLGTAAIVGIVVAAIAVIVIIAVVVFVCRRPRGMDIPSA